MTLYELFTNNNLEVLPCILKMKAPPFKYGERRKNGERFTFQEKCRFKNYFNTDAFCILCGGISKNLECLDFDQQGIFFNEWKKNIPDELFGKLYVETTLKGGFHVIYHCTEPVERNSKLAYTDDGLIAIETRGEGGLVVTAPTPQYKTVQGNILNIAVISSAERKLLLNSARMLNQKQEAPEASKKQVKAVFRAADYDDAYSWVIDPISDFNRRFDLNGFLLAVGWTVQHETSDCTYYCRPFKRDGISASWNGETFYIFSTNTELEAERAYNPFQVYSAYMDSNNYSATYKRIIALGYGERLTYNINKEIFKNIRRSK